MRITSLKLSVLALVVVSLAFVPVASATSLDILFNGSTVGTATLTQNGTGVDVTITMNSTFAIATQGPTVAFFGSGTGATSALTNFSISGMTATAHNGNSFGGFTLFSSAFNTSGGQSQFPTTLSFTITNATAANISGVAIHICLGFDGTGCASTTFVGSGGPPPTVPEPGTLGLLGTGLVGLAGLVRRRLLS